MRCLKKPSRARLEVVQAKLNSIAYAWPLTEGRGGFSRQDRSLAGACCKSGSVPFEDLAGREVAQVEEVASISPVSSFRALAIREVRKAMFNADTFSEFRSASTCLQATSKALLQRLVIAHRDPATPRACVGAFRPKLARPTRDSGIRQLAPISVETVSQMSLRSPS